MTPPPNIELRDYFAALALTTILARTDKQSTSINEVDQWIGSYAYCVADSMLTARNDPDPWWKK